MSYNLMNFAITPKSAVNVNVPRAEITAQIFDAETNALLADYTGANAIMFPSVLATLTADQRRELIDQIAQTLVYMKAGIQ